MSEDSVYAIVVAAGSGSRLGAGVPKAFAQIRGASLLEHALRAIERGAFPAGVVVCAPPDHVERAEAVAERCVVTPGGETRSESVRRGMRCLERSFDCTKDPLVLIHDAARCVVHPQDVRRVLETARMSGAATAASRVLDTAVCATPDGAIDRYQDRSRLWCIQTPQIFRWSLLVRAHESHPDATDDTALVQPLSSVTLVQTHFLNVKVTLPEDLQLAELLLANSEYGNR